MKAQHLFDVCDNSVVETIYLRSTACSPTFIYWRMYSMIMTNAQAIFKVSFGSWMYHVDCDVDGITCVAHKASRSRLTVENFAGSQTTVNQVNHSSHFNNVTPLTWISAYIKWTKKVAKNKKDKNRQANNYFSHFVRERDLIFNSGEFNKSVFLNVCWIEFVVFAVNVRSTIWQIGNFDRQSTKQKCV